MRITETTTQLKIESDYHPDLPKRARNLGGDWDGAYWVFDIRDKNRVEKMYRTIYGYFGDLESITTVNVQLIASNDCTESRKGIFFAGRCIAAASGRDSGARLGEGVIIENGEADSGGSAKNWITRITEDAIIEIKDVPLSKVQQAIKKGNRKWAEIKIISEPDFNIFELEKERELIMARLVEIDEILAAHAEPTGPGI
jgi:hypothetical protein